MQYTRLGTSGLKVSRIALGCMSFGDTSRGFNEWALDDEAAEPIFRQTVDLGITFWDTANGYNSGTSEQAVGRALKELTRRTTSSWRPRCTSQCTTVPAGRVCHVRRSWNRSTPR